MSKKLTDEQHSLKLSSLKSVMMSDKDYTSSLLNQKVQVVNFGENESQIDKAQMVTASNTLEKIEELKEKSNMSSQRTTHFPMESAFGGSFNMNKPEQRDKKQK